MSLCDRCEMSLIFRRRNNAVTYWCSEAYPGIEVPGDIEACNCFKQKNRTTKRQMELIAWQVRTDNSGKIVGFAPPSKDKKDTDRE